MKNNDSPQSEKNSLRWFLAVIAGLPFAALFFGPRLRAQGVLTPPGAPAPTMKSLDQLDAKLEKRTPISSLPFTIAAAGSYYLTGNLTGSASGGITIGASGVTLDLMGFELVGGNGDGISVSAGRSNIVIRDGTVRNWSGHGVNASSAGQGRLERLRAVANQGTGLRIGPNSSVVDCIAQGNTLNGIETSAGCALRDCTVSGNLGTSGISVSSGAVLNNCSAFNNQTTYGIFATDGATLTNCAAYSNNGSGTTSYGIHAGSGSTVIGCAAHSNTNDNATPTESAIGINALFGTLIKGCAVRNNEGHGIMVQSDCRVLLNSCDDNGKSGIRAATSDNRIEGNNVTDNAIGVEVVTLGNFIIANSASGNDSNYEIVAGNKVGTIVLAPDSVAISGDTGGAGVGTTNPWANFSF